MITEGEFLARKGQHNQRVVWVNGFNKGWADLDPKHHANEIAMMGTECRLGSRGSPMRCATG
jgi:hypothetical protein